MALPSVIMSQSGQMWFSEGAGSECGGRLLDSLPHYLYPAQSLVVSSLSPSANMIRLISRLATVATAGVYGQRHLWNKVCTAQTHRP